MILRPGLVVRLAPRYNGNGTYAHDNGAGEILRLIRPLKDGLNWYVTDDLQSPLEQCRWTYMVHVSRLGESEEINGSE